MQSHGNRIREAYGQQPGHPLLEEPDQREIDAEDYDADKTKSRDLLERSEHATVITRAIGLASLESERGILCGHQAGEEFMLDFQARQFSFALVMGKVGRGGYIIKWFIGDHLPRHVHVCDSDEKLLGRLNLETLTGMEGWQPGKKLLQIIADLQREGRS